MMMVGAHIILSLNFKMYMFFSACSLRSDFETTFRLCPMNGGGSFHCIPDVDDDCISDSQVKTHGFQPHFKPLILLYYN